ncbi:MULTISPECIES: 1-deoxy-D-xylulose-5-phosphate reductoisomerase [Synergistales]|nr:1-deoxy-D-xylulose-5-phosphate reductoisomerase [Aminithiophilus ramosus]
MALMKDSRQDVIRLALMGATGSVGSSVLDVCRRFPERFQVEVLAAHSNDSALLPLVYEFRPALVALYDEKAAGRICPDLPADVHLLTGPDSLREALGQVPLDHVVFATSGTEAIPALLDALDASLDVSLANKESLVVAGQWVMPHIRHPHQLRPLDSEHSALWQCLRGESLSSITKVWLTASGGPFLDFTPEEMKRVTPADALSHPVWSMGAKVTVDSATLMNKGIEIIEAMRLFSLPLAQVDAVIQRKSLVHGFVAFVDGAVKALVSQPDMRLSAAAALAFPERLLLEESLALPDPWLWNLSFEKLDGSRFPCFRLAREAALGGGGAPIVLVGADEVAVAAFLNGLITFTAIGDVVEATLSSLGGETPSTLEDALDLLDRSRQYARSFVCGSRAERRYLL